MIEKTFLCVVTAFWRRLLEKLDNMLLYGKTVSRQFYVTSTTSFNADGVN